MACTLGSRKLRDMGFSFGSIGDWLDEAVGWVSGGEENTDETYLLHKDEGSSSGDIFGFIQKGAKAYTAMTDKDDDREAFQSVQHTAPKITRYSGQAPRAAGLEALRNPVGLRNPDVASALRKFINRTSANPHMGRIQSNIMVNRNIQQGRRTVAIESPKSPRATKVKPATVRKEAT